MLSLAMQDRRVALPGSQSVIRRRWFRLISCCLCEKVLLLLHAFASFLVEGRARRCKARKEHVGRLDSGWKCCVFDVYLFWIRPGSGSRLTRFAEKLCVRRRHIFALPLCPFWGWEVMVHCDTMKGWKGEKLDRRRLEHDFILEIWRLKCKTAPWIFPLSWGQSTMTSLSQESWPRLDPMSCTAGQAQILLSWLLIIKGVPISVPWIHPDYHCLGGTPNQPAFTCVYYGLLWFIHIHPGVGITLAQF